MKWSQHEAKLLTFIQGQGQECKGLHICSPMCLHGMYMDNLTSYSTNKTPFCGYKLQVSYLLSTKFDSHYYCTSYRDVNICNQPTLFDMNGKNLT
jgi:hypothetical protein